MELLAKIFSMMVNMPEANKRSLCALSVVTPFIVQCTRDLPGGPGGPRAPGDPIPLSPFSPGKPKAGRKEENYLETYSFYFN